MRKRQYWFTFEHEARWLSLVYVVVPLLALLFAFVIPSVMRALR
jgi:hypothetical protein